MDPIRRRGRRSARRRTSAASGSGGRRSRTGRLEFRNHGVCGEGTEQIAARLGVAAAGADVLVVQGGINDVVHHKSIEQAAQNLERMIRVAAPSVWRSHSPHVLPWNNGDRRAAADIESLNLLVAALAERTGVPLLPFHDTLVAPDQPTRMRDDWTDDGNHPSVEGHRRLGELAFRLPDLWEGLAKKPVKSAGPP